MACRRAVVVRRQGQATVCRRVDPRHHRQRCGPDRRRPRRRGRWNSLCAPPQPCINDLLRAGKAARRVSQRGVCGGTPSIHAGLGGVAFVPLLDPVRHRREHQGCRCDLRCRAGDPAQRGPWRDECAASTRVFAARVMGAPGPRILIDVLLWEALPQILAGCAPVSRSPW